MPSFVIPAKAETQEITGSPPVWGRRWREVLTWELFMGNDDMIENSFTSRVKRYTQVTTAVGGLMARLLGDRYLGFSLDTPRHAQDLKDTLGSLKGPLMKIGQILATVPDMLPPEYAEAFLDLQANAPPHGVALC